MYQRVRQQILQGCDGAQNVNDDVIVHAVICFFFRLKICRGYSASGKEIHIQPSQVPVQVAQTGVHGTCIHLSERVGPKTRDMRLTRTMLINFLVKVRIPPIRPMYKMLQLEHLLHLPKQVL